MNRHIVAVNGLARCVTILVGFVGVFTAFLTSIIAEAAVLEVPHFLHSGHAPYDGWLHFALFLFATCTLAMISLVYGVRLLLRGIRFI